MDATWSNLLSGVIGAVVGGAASLAGTVLVNRMQMATNVRLRLYDELLPKFTDVVKSLITTIAMLFASLIPDPMHPRGSLNVSQQGDEILGAIRRVSAIAGRRESHYAEQLGMGWRELTQTAVFSAAEKPDPQLFEE